MSKTLGKLKAGQPVKIVFWGDSVTAVVQDKNINISVKQNESTSEIILVNTVKINQGDKVKIFLNY